MALRSTAARSRAGLLTSAAALIASAALSCSDPVIDGQIEALGGERGDVPVGELHRPGQPCVLCHSERGTAPDSRFFVAGTIFDTRAPDSKPAAGVTVYLQDALSPFPRRYQTNEAGNFFVRESEWEDLTFPFKVAIERNGVRIPMGTLVNRDGSCNSCHRPNPGSPYALPSDQPRSSIGQIYVDGTAP